MKAAQLYSMLKLIGVCFLGVLLFLFLDSNTLSQGNWSWVILTAFLMSVMAVLFEKWHGIRW